MERKSPYQIIRIEKLITMTFHSKIHHKKEKRFDKRKEQKNCNSEHNSIIFVRIEIKRVRLISEIQ